MKTLLMFLSFSLFVPNAEWLTDFDQAKQLAKEDNKMILLNFSGSDWCAPCIKMKKDVFDKNEFQEYATEKLVLVRADFPRQKKNQLDPKQKTHNERLAEQYNPKGKFPLTLLLTTEGRVVKEWDGFSGMSPTEFITQVTANIHEK